MNLLSDSAVYALKRFQMQMKGEAKKAGFISEDDIAEWITKSRKEITHSEDPRIISVRDFLAQ